jgi:hypothetical protein
MIAPIHLGLAGPLCRAQASLQSSLKTPGPDHLDGLDLMSVDLRLALVTLIARTVLVAANALVRHLMSRAWRGARFAQGITVAATMVAAAGR